MNKELIERLKNEGDGVMSRREKTLLAGYIEELEKERDQLRNELEIERMRNVACGVVAMADTPDSAKQARDMHPDYMSAACSDVARRVDECIKLREQVKMLLDELLRVKVVCLREFGIGVVNENVLSATRE